MRSAAAVCPVVPSRRLLSDQHGLRSDHHGRCTGSVSGTVRHGLLRSVRSAALVRSAFPPWRRLLPDDHLRYSGCRCTAGKGCNASPRSDGRLGLLPDGMLPRSASALVRSAPRRALLPDDGLLRSGPDDARHWRSAGQDAGTSEGWRLITFNKN